MRINIRNRILFIFIGVALIQLLIIGAFFLHQHNKSRNTLVHQQLRTVSENVTGQISTFLETTLHDLETAGQQIERMALKKYQRYNLLQIIQSRHPALSTLVFYDINGTVKSAVSNYKDHYIPDCFTQNSALFEDPYYSGIPYTTELILDNGTLAMGISIPVCFLDNSYIIGVISALLPYESFQKVVGKIILPPALNVLVLTNEGKVLAQTFAKKVAYTQFPAEQLWNGEVIINDIRHISVSSPLKFHGQTLTVAAITAATQPWPLNSSFFILLCLIIIVIVILSALVGWTTHKKIIAPLQLLTNNTRTMLQGKKVTDPAPADAEFHDLSIAMNTMNKKLQKSNISFSKEVKLRRQEEQKAILAKIEAEKANQAKSIFLANMSHEIRSPLHGMLNMLELLEKDSLNAEQNQLLSMATLTGKRLQTMVNSILDLSQIESGKFQLHHSPFSLSALITEVVEFMQLQTENKDIKIISQQAADIPNSLTGDSGRIRQILINLINNSIKFSDQGTIELRIDLQSQPSPNEVQLRFSIKDEGGGISEAARQTIFDAFDRGDQKKYSVVEGNGLGLAISDEFVHHMNGKLWLANSDTHGSTFCFTILCRITEEKSTEFTKPIDESKPEKKLAGIRIFLAEDEFINQRIISAYLEEQGCEVTVCENGQELLDTMKREDADIILMDIRMPILNGLETTEIIRKMEKDSGQVPIPIVALTAQATKDFEEKCKAVGMNDYLTKPIPFEKLIAIICELTGK